MKIHKDQVLSFVLVLAVLGIFINGVQAGWSELVLQSNINETYKVHK